MRKFGRMDSNMHVYHLIKSVVTIRARLAEEGDQKPEATAMSNGHC